jgi:hypothetical protein
MSLHWGYPLANYGQTMGFTGNGIDEFSDDLYGNLAREAIQNSLDARLPGKPAVVEFSLFTTQAGNFPAHDSFVDYIHLWQKSKKNSASFRADSNDWVFFQKALNDYIGNSAKKMAWLQVSDRNTTGLVGCSKEGSQDTPWYAFTKAVGQNEKDARSGGSKGLGKNAFFACSLIRTIIVSTFTKDQEEAFIGIAKLGSCRIDDRSANPDNSQGVLYCVQDNENSSKYFLPTYSQFDLASSVKIRSGSDYGTDVFIPCFEISDTWGEAVLQEAIVSFLPAIIDGELEIIISGTKFHAEIGQSNIAQEIRNTDNYLSGKRSYYDKANSIYRALTSNVKPIKFITSKTGFEMDLYLYEDKQKTTNAVTAYRLPTKMKIKDLHPTSFVDYTGVLLIGGYEICERLKGVENATHSKWSVSKASSTKYSSEQIREAIDAVSDFTDKEVSVLGMKSGNEESDFDWARNQGWEANSSSDILGDKKDEDGLPTSETNFSGDNDDASHTSRRPRKKHATVPDPAGDAEGYVLGTGQEDPNGDQVGSHPDEHNLDHIHDPIPDPHPGPDDISITDGDKPMMVLKPVATARALMPSIDPEHGRLKLIFNPMRSGKDAEITINKLGSDGSDEKTEIVSATMNGVTLESKGNKIKLPSIEKGQQYVIELQVKENQNFIWEVDVSAQE